MEKIYKVLIVEDEPGARELLIDYIASEPRLQLAGIARRGGEGLEKIQNEKFDLVFLDINLPEMTGVELAAQLDKPPALIFTTAYEKHALEAFELGAIDYLLKPISKERFARSVARALQNLAEKPEGNEGSLSKLGLFVKGPETRHFLAYNQIVYISSSGKHSIVHTGTDEVHTLHLIKELESRLPPEQFQRIHKQYIVNLNYISRIEYFIGGSYILHLKDRENSSLPVGRKYAENLK